MYLLDVSLNKLVEAKITPMKLSHMAQVQNGWNFNWQTYPMTSKERIFMLCLKKKPTHVEGMLLLKVERGMLIMDLVEVAPHNFGKNKQYDYVAGCLIAFACRESFQVEGDYKGFLTFVSKTNLIDWYIKKYGATQAIGQRMFIDAATGLQLIDQYLNRKK